MRTRSRTTKSKKARRGARALGDVTTLRNPHARPRRGRRAPAEVYLAAVVDRTSERYEPRLLVQGGESLSWDNMARWSLVYRCRYGSGDEDRDMHERDFVAAGRDGAIAQLQRRLMGFNVTAVEIHAVRAPLTAEQREAVHAANEWLELERRRVGIVGQGPIRVAAIDEWLRK